MPQAVNSAVKFKNLDRKKSRANLVPEGGAESNDDETPDAEPIIAGVQE